jgi:MYXO-CTERM domain-containing protein
MVYPPLIEVDPSRIEQAAEDVPPGGSLQIRAQGISIEGDEVSKTVMLPMGPPAPGAERLRAAGLELRTEDGRVFIDMIGFASAAERAGLDFDFQITSVLGASDRPPKELMWLPALLALGLIVWLQRRRGPALPAPRAAPVAAGED